MSAYTSTHEGFQRAMKWSLTGPPEEAKLYVEGTATPQFFHIFNGKRLSLVEYVQVIEEWRGKIDEYQPVVHEFLRDGDQLAARMTGTIKVDGVDTEFESFLFAKIDKTNGKMESLVERSIWGPAGGPSDHGVH